MPTLTRAKPRFGYAVPSNIPEVEYPAEVVDRWNKEFDILESQVAVGARVPMSVSELMAERGIRL